ncbi:MAG: formyltetrahydrofolate deformylase [Proteobacteria bacterium]|nr:formyltetrahydrofolate deformylase [Pseudomonadota bacterium]
MTDKNRYILTLSCPDVKGIVAAVSTFLADHDGFIIESAQFGDESTGRFFMRTTFEAGSKAPDDTAITRLFAPIALRFKMDWQLVDVNYRPRVLIMVSKEGHCLNDLLHRQAANWLKIEIPAIIGNHADLKSVAEMRSIPFHHIPVTPEKKPAAEKKLMALVKDLNIDLVVLARYMQVLSPEACAALRGKAINIHHSFLPGFKGAKPYHQAYDRGVKIIGATAHYVTGDLDEGPIIEQEVIRVDHTHSPDALRSLGQDIERQVLARAVKYHTEQRVVLNGNKTVVFK